MCIHAVLVLVALLVTNATGAHAIARAAHRSGEKPARAVVDDLGGKEHD
jgi:multicomponent Na+:H+ antiporter subunit G